jgi:hypothetical protein
MKKTVLLSIIVLWGMMLPVFAENQLQIPCVSDLHFQERMEVVVQEIEQNYRPLYDQLLEVQQRDEEMYHILLEELTDHWGAFVILKQENPEIAELEVHTRTLEIQLGLLEQEYHHQPGKEEKARVKEEIKSVLVQIFDTKVNKRQLEIARLQEELQTMQQELTQIVNEKEVHVERKLEQITEGDVFTW